MPLPSVAFFFQIGIRRSLELAAWLEEYLEQMWDKQIETELVSGKLDKLIAKAEADIVANRARVTVGARHQ